MAETKPRAKELKRQAMLASRLAYQKAKINHKNPPRKFGAFYLRPPSLRIKIPSLSTESRECRSF
ncbi:hypothetical protein MY539_02380 [Haemophilus influenzae]